MRPVSLLSHS